MTLQLPLGLELRDDTTFDNYYVGVNQQVFAALQEMLQGKGEPYLFIWGEPGVGRSHLLQACCHALDALSGSTIYLPLEEHDQLHPDMLEDMENLDLICLDDLDAVIGKRDWEEAIFHLYNRVQAQGSRLVIAADVTALQLPCLMPDLRSRLSQGLILQVKALADSEKLAALIMRAKRRGLELNDDVGTYLLNRYPRNMAVLFAMLKKLDQASLAMQRRLTIPFVREVLG